MSPAAFAFVFAAAALFSPAIVQSASGEPPACPPDFQFAEMSVNERAKLAQYVMMGRVTRIVPSLVDPAQYGARISVSYLFKGLFDGNDVELPTEVFVSGFGSRGCRNSVEVRDTKLFFAYRDSTGRLALFYAPDGDRRGEAVSPMRLANLEVTQNTVDELQKTCKESESGCCSDGVTENAAGCPDYTLILNEPDNSEYDLKEPAAEKTTIDIIKGLDLHLSDYAVFAEEHSCPDRSQVDFQIQSGPVSQPMSKVFADYRVSMFPADFSFILLSKQSSDENAYMFSIYQGDSAQFAIRFQGGNLIVQFKSGEATFENSGVADGSFHRFAISVKGDTVSLYVDCNMIGTQTVAGRAAETAYPAKEGNFVIGSDTFGDNSKYGGILETIVFTNDASDAERLCEMLTDCPPPPPTDPPTTEPPPTTPPPPTTHAQTTQAVQNVTVVPSAEVPTVSGSGDVECDDERPCLFFGVCNSAGKCECPICRAGEVMEVVCAGGVSYDNECVAKRTMCQNKMEEEITSGVCDEEPTDDDGPSCKDDGCPYYGICEDSMEGPVCTCAFSCVGEMMDPVCGSDYVTYNNTCLLNKTSCMSMKSIKQMKKGKCEEMPMAPCLGEGEPLAEPGSCTSDEDCPSASYCHKGITFSRCCPMMTTPSTKPPVRPLPPNCANFTFGCCPDRITPAEGNNKEGCPGEVDLIEEMGINEGEGSGFGPADPYCSALETAYSVTEKTDYSMIVTEIFMKFFPRDFSILTLFKTDQKTPAHLLTIYGASSAVQFALTIDGGLLVEYAGDKPMQKKEMMFDDIPLNDGKYHQVAVRVQSGDVTVFVDCTMSEPQPMERDPQAVFDIMGNAMVGRRLMSSKPFDMDLQHLFINPDPDEAFSYCGRVKQLCGAPTPTPTSRATTPPPPTTPTIDPCMFVTCAGLPSHCIKSEIVDCCSQCTEYTPTPTTDPCLAVTCAGLPANCIKSELVDCCYQCTEYATTQPPTTLPPTTQGPTTLGPTPMSPSDGVPQPPRFSGTDSYVAMESFERRPDFKIQVNFTSGSGDGTLVYAGSNKNSHFVSIVMVKREVTFRFNSGSGVIEVKANGKVAKGGEHIVQASVVRSKVSVQLDDRKAGTGKREKKSDKFNFGKETLYYGGYPASLQLVADANVVDGFTGCITGVALHDVKVDFSSAVEFKNLVECKSSGGEAMPTPPDPTEDSCSSVQCAELPKNCVKSEQKGCCKECTEFESTKPPNVTEPPVKLSVPGIPQFSTDDSYLAIEPIERRPDVKISIRFSSGDGEGTLLYTGNTKNGHFLSIIMTKREVEFRFESGSGVVELKASGKVGKGKWHTVTASVNKDKAKVQLDSRKPGSGARAKKSDRFTFGEAKLYFGGYPATLERVEDAKASTGFTGCIKEVVLNDIKVDFSSAVEANQLSECASPE